MKKILLISGKAALTILLFAAGLITLTEFSPIYNFEEPAPFRGSEVFNPYDSLDLEYGWKRANFHTHTRVKGPLNECPDWPDEVLENYRRLGYDILAFSNHNRLTVHPEDSALQINVYEHGINFFKYHKHVYNPSRMLLHDILLPVLPSQRQFEMDYLGRNADFLALNHPDRTNCTTPAIMERLTGYPLMEADCGASSELRHWDEALSSGHYSFCYTNDDCHNSRNHWRIARRCNFLDCPSSSYEDIRGTLLSGRFYSMRIPDFGKGDWDVKYSENEKLPYIEEIGARKDTIYLKLSETADSIRVNGQGHRTLDLSCRTDSLEYILGAEEPYARFTAFLPNGVIIYSNAFARYNPEIQSSPYRVAEHPVNVPLTVLFNLLVAALAFVFFLLALRTIRFR